MAASGWCGRRCVADNYNIISYNIYITPWHAQVAFTSIRCKHSAAVRNNKVDYLPVTSIDFNIADPAEPATVLFVYNLFCSQVCNAVLQKNPSFRFRLFMFKKHKNIYENFNSNLITYTLNLQYIVLNCAYQMIGGNKR